MGNENITGGGTGGVTAGGGAYIDLTVPLNVGSAYSNLATHADGSVIGAGSPIAGSTALLKPLKGEPLTLDSIESMVGAEAVSKLSTSMNIAMQWQGASSVVAIQVQLNSTDPSQPTVPIIPLYYDLATGKMSTTKAGAEALASGAPAPTGGSSAAGAVKQSGNPWLAGNVMVGFLIAFMDLTETLMKTKMAEGNLQIQGMELTVALAKDAATFIMAAATAQNFQHITAAVCAGVSCVSTAICTGVSCGSDAQVKEPETVPDQLPSKPPRDADESDTEYGTGVEEVEGEDDIDTTVDLQQLKLGEMDDTTANVEDVGEETEEEQEVEIASPTGKQTAENEQTKVTQSQEEATEKEGEDEVDIKATDQQTEETAKSTKDQKAQDDWSQKRIERSQERYDIQQRNVGVNERNRVLQFRSKLFQGLQQVISQGNQTVSEGVAANVALIAGQANARKEVIDGIKQVVGQAYMHNMADAFKSNTDLISQVLQTYDAMHRALMDAVASALRAR